MPECLRHAQSTCREESGKVPHIDSYLETYNNKHTKQARQEDSDFSAMILRLGHGCDDQKVNTVTIYEDGNCSVRELLTVFIQYAAHLLGSMEF